MRARTRIGRKQSTSVHTQLCRHLRRGSARLGSARLADAAAAAQIVGATERVVVSAPEVIAILAGGELKRQGSSGGDWPAAD
jgi:hypothetical protein